MEKIKEDDFCLITRDSGERDEWDISLNPIEVYSGKCRYQQGVQAVIGTSQRMSLVFIYRIVAVKENDIIRITLEDGTIKEGIVKTVKKIKMPLSRLCFIRLEVEHDVEVTEG